MWMEAFCILVVNMVGWTVDMDEKTLRKRSGIDGEW